MSTRLRRAPAAAAAAALVLAVLLSAGPASARSRLAPAFHPLSVTFVSAAQGWVLGTRHCRKRVCLELLETTDGGASWSNRPRPVSLLEDGFLEVRFADPSDGWIYSTAPGGPPILWATHDGGKVWRDSRPGWLGSDGKILDLEAAAGKVYVLGSNNAERVMLADAAVTGDGWHTLSTPPLQNPAGGAEQQGALVLHGRSGWLVEGNDRGVTGSARLDASGRWVAWNPPCAEVGGSYAPPAAAGARSLVAVCIIGGFASPLPKDAPPGATLNSGWLYSSTNGGETFAAGPELGRNGELFEGVLAAPAPGVLLLGETHGDGQLARSTDGGAHWTVVYRGNPLYLGFTTPTQGVGIVGPQSGAAGASTLIMSRDGGRLWQPVNP